LQARIGQGLESRVLNGPLQEAVLEGCWLLLLLLLCSWHQLPHGLQLNGTCWQQLLLLLLKRH
jgi:hypothetical protein